MSGDATGSAVDLEAEGLLDGADDERARGARIELLEHLLEAGVGVEDLRTAVAEDRLALLPAELALAGEGRHTLAEVAEETGLGEEFLLAMVLALGLPRPRADAPVATDADVRAARAVKFFRDSGISEEGVLDITRTIGQGMSAAAATVLRHAGEALLEAGDTERDVGLRYAEAARTLVPEAAPLLEFLLRVHMRDGIREAVVGRLERDSGRIASAREVTVGFADLEKFTALGERLGAEEAGRVAGRLAVLAGEVADPPVRLVKTVGDAAMLASFDPPALMAAVHRLVDLAEEEGEEFPAVRAGVAFGPALGRNGDWFGAPVNTASRVTSEARPGSVVVTREVRDRAAEGYRYSRLPPRRLKGIEGSVRLYRSRRAEPDADGAEEGAGSDQS